MHMRYHLTIRGLGLAGTGILLIFLSWALGAPSLLPVAFLLILLPIVALLITRLTFRHVSVQRTESSYYLAAGQEIQIALALNNRTRRHRTLIVSDTIPREMGVKPRLWSQLPPYAKSKVTYHLRAHQRGNYQLGPITVSATDVFGLVHLITTHDKFASLTVTPRIHALATASWLNAAKQGITTQGGALVGGAGEYDFSLRPYQYGDDLRGVHWRSSARAGELMVRHERALTHPWALIFLDSRASSHEHSEKYNSLEWGISAAASIAIRLGKSGYRPRLLTDTGQLIPQESGLSTLSSTDLDANTLAIIDALTPLEPSKQVELNPIPLTYGRSLGSPALVIAVLGTVTQADLATLSLLASPRTTEIALLTNIAQPFNTHPKESVQLPHELLTNAGWTVVTVNQQNIETVWGRINQPNPASHRYFTPGGG